MSKGISAIIKKLGLSNTKKTVPNLNAYSKS